MIQEAIIKIVQKQDLTFDESYVVMSEIMRGETTPTQNAAFLAALSTKSARAETIDEISGCAAAMRDRAIPFDTRGLEVLEIVGTGGDGSGSINISSTAAVITAAAGVAVAKHGNVAASSRCGAANVLEALGVDVKVDPEKMEQVLQSTGLAFLHAQVYHTSMKYVGAIRRELGFRTVFNILGPLTNPARPTFELLGAYDEYLLQPLAQVLSDMGVRRGMTVHGLDGLDEVSVCAPTAVCEFNDGWFKTYTIAPEDFGLQRGTKADLVGGDPEENAEISRQILAGGLKGPKRDAVLLNAGCALMVAGRTDSIADGISLAADTVDSGAALAKLTEFAAATQV